VGAAVAADRNAPGAFVAMNVKNGQILGLGSSPSFDPAVFSKPVIPTSVYKQLTSQTTYAPLTNRASDNDTSASRTSHDTGR